jgi:hypothetical protein
MNKLFLLINVILYNNINTYNQILNEIINTIPITKNIEPVITISKNINIKYYNNYQYYHLILELLGQLCVIEILFYISYFTLCKDDIYQEYIKLEEYIKDINKKKKI